MDFTYRQLQQALRYFKDKGITNIKLNSKKAVLQAELERIKTNIANPSNLEVEPANNIVSFKRKRAQIVAIASEDLSTVEAFNKSLNTEETLKARAFLRKKNSITSWNTWFSIYSKRLTTEEAYRMADIRMKIGVGAHLTPDEYEDLIRLELKHEALS